MLIVLSYLTLKCFASHHNLTLNLAEVNLLLQLLKGIPALVSLQDTSDCLQSGFPPDLGIGLLELLAHPLKIIVQNV